MKTEIGEYITELVKFLEKNNKVMSYQQLVEHLEFNDLNEYSQTHGIGQGIKKLGGQLEKAGKDYEASCLASRIVHKLK